MSMLWWDAEQAGLAAERLPEEFTAAALKHGCALCRDSLSRLFVAWRPQRHQLLATEVLGHIAPPGLVHVEAEARPTAAKETVATVPEGHLWAKVLEVPAGQAVRQLRAFGHPHNSHNISFQCHLCERFSSAA